MSVYSFAVELPRGFGQYHNLDGACILDEVPEYRSAEWIEWRRNFIGGSDIPIIMGANPYKSPLDLWREKTGRDPVDTSTSEPAKWGLTFEPHILEALRSKVNGNHVRAGKTAGAMLTCLGVDIPCISSLDGITHVGQALVPELLEAKLTASRAFRGERRDSDYWQVLWGLMVTGYSRGHIGVLHMGTKLYHYEVLRAPADEIAVAEAVANFWKCVLTGVPPEGYAKDPVGAGAEIQDADPILSGEIERLYEIDDMLSTLEMESDSIKETILSLAADRGARGFISCITNRKANIVTTKGRTTTDWKKVAAEAGVPKDIIDRNTKTGGPSMHVRLDNAKGTA